MHGVSGECCPIRNDPAGFLDLEEGDVVFHIVQTRILVKRRRGRDREECVLRM